MRTILYTCLACIFCMFMNSCTDKVEVTTKERETNQEVVDQLLKRASTDWGLSGDSLDSYMKGYERVSRAATNLMLYRDSKSKQVISYLLKNGKLCATTIIMPRLSQEMEVDAILKGYSYNGRLGQSEILENLGINTMGAVWDVVDGDSTFSAIGLAPIVSDAYEPAPPLYATTKAPVEIGYCNAKLSGSVSGVDTLTEVGFVYGRSSNLSEYSEQKVKTKSKGDFTIELTGLPDDATIYYCAYALVDEIYYVGDVKSLQTKQYTYTQEGKTYKMIKVEGGPMPDFSIMQTEWTDYSSLDHNHDGAIIKAEFKNFLNQLREETGLNLRLPTKEEWQYAASGGSKSRSYQYSGSNNVNDVAWYKSNCNGVQPIAGKTPNELGLYDMSGNYGELTNDTDDEYNVDGDICGGCWKDDASACKVDSFVKGSTTGKIAGTQINEKNAYDASKVSFRLVYTR